MVPGAMEKTYLNNEHGNRRDLHVMTELEIIEKGNSLSHAYITVRLEAHISYRFSWQYHPHYIFRDDI